MQFSAADHEVYCRAGCLAETQDSRRRSRFFVLQTTMKRMQVLEAGSHKYLLLELDPEFIGNIARQAGFEFKMDEGKRLLSLDLLAPERKAPLLSVRCRRSGQSRLVLAVPILRGWPNRSCVTDSAQCREPAGPGWPASASCCSRPNREGIARDIPDAGSTADQRTSHLCSTLQFLKCPSQYRRRRLRRSGREAPSWADRTYRPTELAQRPAIIVADTYKSLQRQ